MKDKYKSKGPVINEELSYSLSDLETSKTQNITSQ